MWSSAASQSLATSRCAGKNFAFTCARNTDGRVRSPCQPSARSSARPHQVTQVQAWNRNWRTPANEASGPSASARSGLPGSPVTIASNAATSERASAGVVPISRSASTDAAAIDTATVTAVRDVDNPIAVDEQLERHDVAAHRIVDGRRVGRVRERAAVMRMLAVLDDQPSIQLVYRIAHARIDLARARLTVDQRGDIRGVAVQAERCTRARADAEPAVQRLRAVMTRANRDAIAIEHGREVVRMNAVDRGVSRARAPARRGSSRRVPRAALRAAPRGSVARARAARRRAPRDSEPRHRARSRGRHSACRPQTARVDRETARAGTRRSRPCRRRCATARARRADRAVPATRPSRPGRRACGPSTRRNPRMV